MKRKLNFNYFLIMSLAIHLGIAWGFGDWVVAYINDFNLGKDNEQVILLEIGWSKTEPKLTSPKTQIVEKKEIKRQVKIKKEIKEKNLVKVAKKISERPRSSISQKSGRSGREKLTLLSGSNSYLEEVRRQIEKTKFYPSRAKMARIEGEVTLEFQIDRWGKVQNINLIQPSKHKDLNLAARKILVKASPFPKPMDTLIIDRTIETTLVFELTY